MIWNAKERTEDGGFRFDRELSDSIYIGTELATKQRVVLTKLVSTDLSLDELRAKFDYTVEGVAPLRAIVTTTNHSGPPGAVCVESAPEGKSLAEAPVASQRRGAVALELARIISRAHQESITLAGLRPDLTFIGEKITIATRWARFGTLRSKQLRYIDDHFAKLTPAERFFDLTLAWSDDPRVDVYLLGLSISWLWTDRFALDEDDVREPWPGPPELDQLVGRMISRDPEKRPKIDDVVAVLARFVAI